MIQAKDKRDYIWPCTFNGLLLAWHKEQENVVWISNYLILIVNLDISASLIVFDPVSGMQKLAARRNFSHVL